jgi:hypothetical protein
LYESASRQGFLFDERDSSKLLWVGTQGSEPLFLTRKQMSQLSLTGLPISRITFFDENF